MSTLIEIFSFLDQLAPVKSQMNFDNSGFLVGHNKKTIHRTLLSLDVTSDVVREAIELGSDLIISHHPIIFKPIKSLTDTEPNSSNLLSLVENGISVISMHTNLDIADDGVNDALVQTFDYQSNEDIADGLGRICQLQNPISLQRFLCECKSKLQVNGIRYVEGSQFVSKIAFLGGAGSEFIRTVCDKKCDTYVTSDIKYHDFILARELHLNLIDADHYCTENPVINRLKLKLSLQFPDVEFTVSEVHKQVIKFF